jgi:hypothetical protein
VTSVICTICQRVEATVGLVCHPCQLDLHRGLSELDTLAKLLPAAAEPGRSASQRVGGSRETPTGTRLVALDLSLPLRASQRLADGVTDPWGDQVGHVPVAAWLDQWCRDWITYCGPELLPDPTIPAMVSWLRQRLGWACSDHLAVDEFGAELYDKIRTCRRVLNVDTTPQHLHGRVCPGCSAMNVWHDLPDLTAVAADHPVHCRSCGNRWTWDEYDERQQSRARIFQAQRRSG